MRVFSLVLMAIIGLSCKVFSQSGLEENFDDNTLTNWNSHTFYTLTETNQELKVDVAKTGSQWEAFYFTFPALDLSLNPYVTVYMKASPGANVRIDLQDINNRVTNRNEVTRSVSGATYRKHTYDFTGLFYQQYPTNAAGPVDASQITSLVFIVNPGGNYSGTIYIDSIKIGTATGITPPPGGIVLNQVGFYPDENKLAIVSDSAAGPFYLVKQPEQDTVYTGQLGPVSYWSYSGEYIRQADFSDYQIEGIYRIHTHSIEEPSHPFEIKEAVHHDALVGGLKSYYYQRASMPLEAEYAGIWARLGGYFDKNVLVHSSAATTERPAGTTIATPGGWFDAGDYGKYIVNSGISTYQLLALYEHYPKYFDTLFLNIPESNNQIPDLLNEALYNLRWMLTMQDLDGGVYHKTTALRHDNNVMPHQANLTRYVIGKSTAATLDFAAVMAQAARIFKPFESELPGLSDSMIVAAERAYDWAMQNPARYFTNPSGVSTGEYGDNNVSDEFIWARAELLISTRREKYLNPSDISSTSFDIPGWQNVKTLALISYLHHKNTIADYLDTSAIKNKLFSAANPILSYYNSSAYKVGMGTNEWNFVWGSNAVAGNQGMILLSAYRASGNKNFYDAALANLDYLLGRNATNYSFLTGFGDNYPMKIHHRPSEKDGIEEPVPGLLAGGPHGGNKTDCNEYPSSIAAKMYTDQYCSYSTNENAINYNSAFVYLAGGIEGTRLNAYETGPIFTPLALKGKSINTRNSLSVYPNPSTGKIYIKIPQGISYSEIKIMDVTGSLIEAPTLVNNTEVIVENLPKGLFIVTLNDHSGNSYTEKIIVR